MPFNAAQGYKNWNFPHPPSVKPSCCLQIMGSLLKTHLPVLEILYNLKWCTSWIIWTKYDLQRKIFNGQQCKYHYSATRKINKFNKISNLDSWIMITYQTHDIRSWYIMKVMQFITRKIFKLLVFTLKFPT